MWTYYRLEPWRCAGEPPWPSRCCCFTIQSALRGMLCRDGPSLSCLPYHVPPYEYSSSVPWYVVCGSWRFGLLTPPPSCTNCCCSRKCRSRDTIPFVLPPHQRSMWPQWYRPVHKAETSWGQSVSQSIEEAGFDLVTASYARDIKTKTDILPRRVALGAVCR